MKLARDENGNRVVALEKRAGRGDSSGGAFGVTIARSGKAAQPANMGRGNPFGSLVFDETQAYYVATLDGALVSLSDQYHILSARLGDAQLAPGAPELIGKGSVGALKAIIEDVVASGTTVRAREVLRIEGQEIVFRGRHIPIRDEDGEIIAITGVYEDITSQVRGVEDAARAQSRFQDFARASSDWFWESDTELKITELSDRFTAMIGRPASLYKGSRFEHIGEVGKNHDGRSEMARAVEGLKPFRDQLLNVSDDDGNVIKVHLSGVPVFDRKTGNHTGFRGVGTDVTRRYEDAEIASKHRLELEEMLKELTRKNMALDEANEVAKAALKAKSEFLAAMSHELRTPLNAVIGFASAIESKSFGELQPEYLQYAGDIHSAGRHLLGLINDILDLSVIESGGLTLHIEDIPLEVIVNQAVNMNVSRAQEKSIDTSAWMIAEAWDVLAERTFAEQFSS